MGRSGGCRPVGVYAASGGQGLKRNGRSARLKRPFCEVETAVSMRQNGRPKKEKREKRKEKGWERREKREERRE